MPQALNRQRREAAEKYRPHKVRLLLVAQTPLVARPGDPSRYFYFEDVDKHDFLFRSVVWTALGVEPDRGMKSELLARLRSDGIFLIDLKTDPADSRPYSDLVPSLMERCRQLEPEQIILIKSDVYKSAFARMAAAGFPVIDAHIPFPSSGRQKQFAVEFAQALVVARRCSSDLPIPKTLSPENQPYYAVAPEHGLYLQSYRHGNDARFAKLIKNVWEHISPDDQDTMIRHWRSFVSVSEGRLGISIALENLSKLRRTETVAICAELGTAITFYAHVMDLLPERLAQYVIAHELAHVLQVSRGQHLLPPPHPLGELVAYVLSPVEREADQIAAAWGFEGGELKRWMDYHVDWNTFPPDPY